MHIYLYFFTYICLVLVFLIVVEQEPFFPKPTTYLAIRNKSTRTQNLCVKSRMLCGLRWSKSRV